MVMVMCVHRNVKGSMGVVGTPPLPLLLLLPWRRSSWGCCWSQSPSTVLIPLTSPRAEQVSEGATTQTGCPTLAARAWIASLPGAEWAPRVRCAPIHAACRQVTVA